MSPKKKQRPPADPRVKLFIEYAYQTYRSRYKTKLIISAADAAQVKRILKALDDLELLKRYWNYFLYYRGEDFILKSATKDIKTFCSQINRIVQLTKRAAPSRRPDVGRYDPENAPPAMSQAEFDEIMEDMFGGT